MTWRKGNWQLINKDYAWCVIIRRPVYCCISLTCKYIYMYSFVMQTIMILLSRKRYHNYVVVKKYPHWKLKNY